jgi:16S rRNA (guanine966-N2)-methyltransferase
VRIIAGEWKGLQLVAPKGQVARPTTDRVKESMFNLMGWNWGGGAAVDLFAGSGALGLEALSRGATRALFADIHPASIAAIRSNVKRCRAEDRAIILRQDWLAAWHRIQETLPEVGWVFVDPPYQLNLWNDVLAVVCTGNRKPQDGIVCEHPKTTVLPDRVGDYAVWKSRVYGDIVITIYRLNRGEGEES